MSNINLIFTLNGQNILIQARSDEMFAEAALRYIQKAGLQENDAPKFFFNSDELKKYLGASFSVKPAFCIYLKAGSANISSDFA